MELNYEQDVKIDEQALDIEWLEQAALFLKYARHAANMRKELDAAKENLDVIKAEADNYIRKNPAEFKIEKVTEAVVTSLILQDETVQKANKRFNDAKYELDMAQAAVSAMNQRKDALENLVKLHGQSYFAGPKVPRDLKWEREEKEKRTNAGVASKISRRK